MRIQKAQKFVKKKRKITMKSQNKKRAKMEITKV